VMYTGRLRDDKGVETLVQAATEVDATIYIVGGSQDEIDRVRRTVDIPENVTLTGFLEPSKIPLYQVASDVLVAPYTESDLEINSPLKIFEYLAAGKPIVVSDRKIVYEVLTESKNAVFCTPKDADALAASITEVLTDTEFAAKLARNASETAQQYSYEKRADRILEFLHTRPNRETPVPRSDDANLRKKEGR